MTRDEIAQKVARYDTIHFPYPPHTAFHEVCDYLVKLGRLTRGQPQKGARVLAPTGSGKTASARAFARLFEDQNPPGPEYYPIVHVSLEHATTPKKLMMSILDVFGSVLRMSNGVQS